MAETEMAAFVGNTAFKNRFLRNWPTKDIDGVRVMDKFIFFDGHVIDTPLSRKIYKLLGTNAKELRKNEYGGVDKCWFYMKTWELPLAVRKLLTQEQVEEAITVVGTVEEQLRIEFRYIENVQDSETFQQNYKSSETVMAEFYEQLNASNYSNISYGYAANRSPVLALLDLTNAAFTRTFSAVGKGTAEIIETNRVGHIKKTVPVLYINFSYMRKDPAVVSEALLTKLNATNIEANYIVSKDFYNVYDYFVSGTATDLFHYEARYTLWGDSEYVYDPIGYVKYDGLKTAKLNVFKKYLGKSLDTGYSRKKASAWERFAVFVLAIAVVALTYWFLGPAGLAILGPATNATVVIAYAALTLAVSAAVLGYAAVVASRSDRYGLAAAFGNVSVMLNKMGEYLGYISLIAAWKSSTTSFFTKEMTKEAAAAAGREVVATTGRNVVVRMTAMEMGAQVLRWMSTGFGMWSKYQAKKTQSEITDMQRKVSEQEEALNDLPTPKKYAAEQYMFESYTFLEINEQMDPYIDSLTNMDNFTGKYF
jgi:hypothetical protein